MAVNISNVHSVSGVVNLFCFKFLKFFLMLHEGIDLREFGNGRGFRRRNPHPWFNLYKLCRQWSEKSVARLGGYYLRFQDCCNNRFTCISKEQWGIAVFLVALVDLRSVFPC